MKSKTILIIYNPAAHGGDSKKIFDLYVLFLNTHQITHTSYTTDGKNDNTLIPPILKDSPFTAISIIGGDGTINLAINAIPDLTTPIHIIPAGTGNDLAKMLYNTIAFPPIFNLITKENYHTKKVDIWQCNDRKFINGFGAGFDGAIANSMNKQTYLIKGKIKYWIEILRHICFFRSRKININGTNSSTFMLSIANGRVYGGDFHVAPNALIDDRLLDVVQIGKIIVPMRFFYLPILKKGKHLNKSFVTHKQENTITVSADHKIPAHIDGEPMLASSYKITYAGSIPVLC